MRLLDNVLNRFGYSPKTRDLSVADLQLISNFQQDSYLSGGSYGYVSSNSSGDIGTLDSRVTPSQLYYINQDPVVVGMKRVIFASLFKKKWAFQGSRNKTISYTKNLKALGWDKICPEIVETLIGTGGGNGLLFFEKYKGFYKLRFEPFICDNYQRVRIYPDFNRREITKYDILSPNQSILKTVTSEQAILVRYFEGGDFRFSENPTISAAKAWNLKYQSMMSTQTTFANGNQIAKVISPDFGQAKDDKSLIALMNGWEKMSLELKQGQGLSNRNRDLVSRIGLRIDKVGATNVDMQTLQLKQECDKEMQAAFGVALSNLGFTESANYSTSEQNRENVNELNTAWLSKKLSDIVYQLMIKLDPNFEDSGIDYIHSYDPTTEDLAIREQNLKTIEIYQKTPDLFEIDDKMLENLGLKKKAITEAKTVELTNQQPELKQPDEVKELDTAKRAKTPKNLTEIAEDSTAYSTFNNRLKRAIEAQLQDYVGKIETSKDLNKLKIKKLETFYDFKTFKRDLMAFADISREYASTKYAPKRAIETDSNFGEYPQDVLDWFDDRTKFLLQGNQEYLGLDNETQAQINPIIQANINESTNIIAKKIRDLIPTISANRAENIARTEVTTAVEHTQYLLLKDEFPFKDWLTTINDVCPLCVGNQRQGRIGVNQIFTSGVATVPAHPQCRCSSNYYVTQS